MTVRLYEGALHGEISVLLGGPPADFSLSPPCSLPLWTSAHPLVPLPPPLLAHKENVLWGHSRKVAFCKLRALTRTQVYWHPRLRLPASRSMKKCISVFVPPGYGMFVMTAWADFDTGLFPTPWIFMRDPSPICIDVEMGEARVPEPSSWKLPVCAPSRFGRVTLWTVAHQAPQSMGFSRQEYWSGLPCPLHLVKASGLETEKWSTSPDTRTKGEGMEPGLCLQAHCPSLSQVLINQNSYPHEWEWGWKEWEMR